LNAMKQMQHMHRLKHLRVFLPAQVKHFLNDESGQDLIEYVLAAALMSMLAITALKALGVNISGGYSSVASNLTSNT
jgi:Flp pilus assembly pilin Flp